MYRCVKCCLLVANRAVPRCESIKKHESFTGERICFCANEDKPNELGGWSSGELQSPTTKQLYTNSIPTGKINSLTLCVPF